MSEKAHLNGAFYGPAIPPPSSTKRTSYHRPGRGGGFGCCCGCIFSCIFNIVLSIVITVGLAVFVFWLIFRPNRIKFYVTDAKLTAFNLTGVSANAPSSNQLQYNLALNITIRNPNKKIGVYYDRVEARAFFEGKRFDTKELGKFYTGHKNTTTLGAVFAGQSMVVLGAEEVSEFNEQKAGGYYDIDVKLYLKIRFKIGVVKSWGVKPRIKCELKVPLSVNGVSTVGFERTGCDIDF